MSLTALHFNKWFLLSLSCQNTVLKAPVYTCNTKVAGSILRSRLSKKPLECQWVAPLPKGVYSFICSCFLLFHAQMLALELLIDFSSHFLQVFIIFCATFSSIGCRVFGKNFLRLTKLYTETLIRIGRSSLDHSDASVMSVLSQAIIRFWCRKVAIFEVFDIRSLIISVLIYI